VDYPEKRAAHRGMHRNFSWIIVAALALFVAACANQRPFMHPWQSYEGPVRPIAEHATVFIVSYGPSGYAGLHSFIDGMDGRRITLTRAAPLEIYVLPGEHRFDMVAGDGSARRADGVVTLTAEAGRSYEIVAQRVGAEGVIWSVIDRGENYRRTDIVYQEALQHGFVTERTP
jgi:hypothetical protein